MEDKYKFFRYAYLLQLARFAVLQSPVCSPTYSIHYSGVLSAMSAMVNLEVPWINIMSKMDLVSGTSEDPGRGRNGICKKRKVARCAVVLCVASEQLCDTSRWA